MPALIPENTARLYLDYVVAAQRHTLIVRYTSGIIAASAADIWRTMLLANDAAFGSNVEFDGARVSELGTNVTNPIPWDIVEFVGTAVAAVDAPRFVSFVGRDTQGLRVRYYLYGINFDTLEPADYRLTGEELPVLAALQNDFYDVLTETGAVTIGNNLPVMKSYANVGYSAYYQRKARG